MTEITKILKLFKDKPYLIRMGAGKIGRRYEVSPENVRRARSLLRKSMVVSDRPVDKLKILILDIETSPLKAYVWSRWKQNIYLDQTISEWFMICWSAKWLGEDSVMADVLTPEEISREDDERITKRLWGLLDEANIVIAHNGCMTPGHRVLKKDLSWVNVEDLKIGDELLAFDESPGRDRKPRKYKTSIVTATNLLKKECVKITLENGETLTCSKDHPFLARFSKRYRHWQWVMAKDLSTENKTSNCLTKVLNVCDRDYSYHSGYLAAFFDSDGCLSQHERKGRENGFTFSCTFSQKDDAIIDKLKISLDYFDFKYSIINYDSSNRDQKSIKILGGLSENIRFLSICNPQKRNRLNMSKFSQIKMSGILDLGITKIEDVGIQEVVQLSTSSHTYICEGFPMHNCSFDIPKINSRFLLHGMPPPSPYKQIDTRVVASKQFGFSSNKLDALAGYFGIEHKDDTSFKLWVDCLNGDKKALDYMLNYNIKDIKILEKVYLRLRPWIKNHPNLGIYLEEDHLVCPSCGGSHMEEDGSTYYTNVNKYKMYRCNGCGAVSRARKSSYPSDIKNNLLISTP